MDAVSCPPKCVRGGGETHTCRACRVEDEWYRVDSAYSNWEGRRTVAGQYGASRSRSQTSPSIYASLIPGTSQGIRILRGRADNILPSLELGDPHIRSGYGRVAFRLVYLLPPLRFFSRQLKIFLYFGNCQHAAIIILGQWKNHKFNTIPFTARFLACPFCLFHSLPCGRERNKACKV